MHAKVLTPPIFIAQDPQMPSRHDLLKVNVGSISFLILIKASNTIGLKMKLKSKMLYKYYNIFTRKCSDQLHTLAFLVCHQVCQDSICR